MHTARQGTARRRRLGLRVLQALLASFALAVVIAPAAGAMLAREVPVLLTERPGGGPPPGYRSFSRVAAHPVASRGRVVTYARSLAPSVRRQSAIVVRDLLRVTRRILC